MTPGPASTTIGPQPHDGENVMADDEIRHLIAATAVQRTLIECLLADSWEREADPLEAAKAFSESILEATTGMDQSISEDIRLRMTEMLHSIVDDATALLHRRRAQP